MTSHWVQIFILMWQTTSNMFLLQKRFIYVDIDARSQIKFRKRKNFSHIYIHFTLQKSALSILIWTSNAYPQRMALEVQQKHPGVSDTQGIGKITKMLSLFPITSGGKFTQWRSSQQCNIWYLVVSTSLLWSSFKRTHKDVQITAFNQSNISDFQSTQCFV